MKTLRSKIPRVYELEKGRYQLDLRGKRLEPIRLAVTNGQQRMNFTNRAKALAKAAELESILLTHGGGTLSDFGQLVSSNGELTKYVEVLAIHGKTLSDAAEFYLAHLTRQDEIRRSRPISAIIDEWLEAKANNRNRPVRPETLSNLRSRSNKIKGTFGEKRLQEVTAEMVEDWTNAMEGESQTREHYRNIFGQMFRWAIKKRYCETNPCSSVEIVVENRPPEYMEAADVRRTLGFCQDSPVYAIYLPMHLVGFFAGVRVKEMQRMTWDNFNLDQGYIDIPKEVAKTKKRRVVRMEDNLVTSLREWRKKNPQAPFAPKRNISDGLKRLRANLRKLEIEHPHNVMRHSYASYFYAKCRSFDRLEANMGDSKAVLEEHYLTFPTAEQAEEYFAISFP